MVRRHDHHLAYVPEPEVPTRLVKQLGELAMLAAYVLRLPVDDNAIVSVVKRVCLDTVPSERLEILDAIGQGSPTTEALVDQLRIPRSTLREWLEDLWLLGILERGEHRSPCAEEVWSMSSGFRDTWSGLRK